MEPAVVGNAAAGAEAGADEDGDDAPSPSEGDGLPLVVGPPRAGGWRDASRVTRHAVQLEGRRVVWLGRICAVRVCGSCVLYIGPHWYCTILMLGVVVGVGSAFTRSMAEHAQTLHTVLGVLCTLGSAESLLRCALVNPGILVGQDGRPVVACDGSEGEVPKGAEHCDMCQVYIAGWDHHCPWMSKCIGEGNLAEFHTFLCCAFGSLAYIIITTITTT